MWAGVSGAEDRGGGGGGEGKGRGRRYCFDSGSVRIASIWVSTTSPGSELGESEDPNPADKGSRIAVAEGRTPPSLPAPSRLSPHHHRRRHSRFISTSSSSSFPNLPALSGWGVWHRVGKQLSPLPPPVGCGGVRARVLCCVVLPFRLGPPEGERERERDRSGRKEASAPWTAHAASNMAPITASREEFDEIPTVVGIFSAFGLVFTVSLFAWICCQRKSSKANKTPPYKFVHVLKGVDIYPENLNSKKKFGAEDKGEATNKPTMPKTSLHLDLEKQDLNGNFPKTIPKMPSSSDVEGFTPKLFPEREKDSVSPDSLKSTTSISSEEKQDTLGTLFFSLEYNFEKKAFMVNIKEARGLPAMDEQSMTSDPYIKMTILPEKKHKVKTRVLRKTLDPAFDETFTFYGIPYTQIQDLSLHFMILSFDRFSRDDIIGEVLFPLSGIELSEGKMLMNKEIIKKNVRVSVQGLSVPSSSCSSLASQLLIDRHRQPAGYEPRVSNKPCSAPTLCTTLTQAYEPGEEATVEDCQVKQPPRSGTRKPHSPHTHCPPTPTMSNLAKESEHSISSLEEEKSSGRDPYVKVNLYHAKKRISKKKTHVKKCTPNAVFNELFVFDIPCQGLEEISIEFLVLDSDRGSRNDIISRLTLGASAEGTAGEHWKEICEYPRRQIAKWHMLCDG
ncbi:synaptotagmin-4 [Crotalus adamanteus]|uniref:Synaptotagmin-4 n=1 Tax=Crotalus adamanteus TaxID=8729 RepID=A0AAW1C374_CROAD